MKHLFVPCTGKQENLFANGDPQQTSQELIHRIENPEIHDMDMIDEATMAFSKYEKESDEKARQELDEELQFLTSELSFFNLNRFWSGWLPEESFIESKFITFYFEARNNIDEIKELLIKEPLVHCVFKGHLGVDLIVILKLCQPVTDYNLYNFLFEYCAKVLEQKIGLTPMNNETPLATFFIPYDTDIYVNEQADLIHVVEVLESLMK